MNSRELVPVIGAGGGGGKGGGGGQGGATAPVEAPDSLRSIQYARVINVICEGEVEGIVGGAQGIFVDDTPLQNADGSWNFSGAAIEWRSGTPDQSPISGFSASESENTVGVMVTAAMPVTRSVTNPNMSGFRITLGFPALTYSDPATGNLSGTAVQLAIEAQRNSGGFQRLYTDTVDGKTTSRYQRSYRIDLQSRFGTVGGTYDFRVVRLTPDATTSNVQDKFQWETYTEIVDSMLTYPYSALVGVQVDASGFKSVPRLAFDIRMRRIQVPDNYDPASRTYNGIWQGKFKIAWCDNPAWVVYDLVTTARFGLGDYIAPELVDKWTLYAIGRYCDGSVPNGFGGWEPRYICNAYVQTRADAIALLQQFVSIFNGVLFWSGGALSFAADMPGDTVMMYSTANILDGAFSYVGTPLNQRHTTALVTWNDPADDCKATIEYVEDPDGIALWGIRALSLTAFGCTSRGQAHRVGKWALLTERLLGETISFKTGVNAAYARPGDIFATTDPTRAGVRMGGRILEAYGDTVRLDAPVTLDAGVQYTLTVMLADGTLETRDVGYAAPGPTDTLKVTQPFTHEPPRMAIWILAGTNLVAELWRCVGAAEDESGNIEINGVGYRPDKFDAIEFDLQLSQRPTSIIDPFHIGPCTELVVKEAKYEISPVVVGACATFSWLAPLGAVRYTVIYQFQNEAAVVVESAMSSIDIRPTQEGMWTFNVWAYNSIGVRSVAATLTVELHALNMPPGDVKRFRLDIYNDAANLAWAPAEDLDVIVGGTVVIRFTTKMSTSVLWEEANEIAMFSGAQTNGFCPLMKGTYFAKFRNSSGKLSQNAALVVSTTGPLRDYDLIEDLKQEPDFAGDKVNMDVQYGVLYLLRAEDGYAVATEGGYYFDHGIDLGKVYTCRCQTYIEGAVYQYFNDVDTWEDWDEVLDVDGTKIDEGGGVVLASTTNLATPAEEDWSPWTRLVSADLTFRQVRFAMACYVNDDTQGIGITNLGATVNVPDRIESRNDVLIAAGGTTITFSVAFMGVPAISIIAQDLHTGDKWLIDQQGANGFRIQFQDSAGTPLDKVTDWIARGYGYEHADLANLSYSDLCNIDTARAQADRARIGPKNLKGS